jgi:hypothetical protein
VAGCRQAVPPELVERDQEHVHGHVPILPERRVRPPTGGGGPGGWRLWGPTALVVPPHRNHDVFVTIEVPKAHGSSVEPSDRKSRVRLIGTAALVVLVAAIVGVLAFRGADSTDTSLEAQRLASVQQACTQWHESDTGMAAVRCHEMTRWMSDQMRGGRRMGSMMWGNTDELLASCTRWASSNTTADGSTPDGPAWCGRMVAWMTKHMGDRGRWDRGWMANGPMMGG